MGKGGKDKDSIQPQVSLRLPCDERFREEIPLLLSLSFCFPINQPLYFIYFQRVELTRVVNAWLNSPKKEEQQAELP